MKLATTAATNRSPRMPFFFVLSNLKFNLFSHLPLPRVITQVYVAGRHLVMSMKTLDLKSKPSPSTLIIFHIGQDLPEATRLTSTHSSVSCYRLRPGGVAP